MRPSWRPGENLDPQAPLQTSKLCFSKEGVAILHLFALDRYHHHMIEKQTRNKRDALRSHTAPVPIHPSLLSSSKRNCSFTGLLCVLPVMFLYANRGTQTHFLLPLTKGSLPCASQALLFDLTIHQSSFPEFPSQPPSFLQLHSAPWAVLVYLMDPLQTDTWDISICCQYKQ